MTATLLAPPAAPAHDGSTAVAIRRIGPSDAPELERFYECLSDDSRWYRFLGATRGLSHAQSDFFCAPDHAHREGFVAVLPGPCANGGDDQIVGHLCLEPTGPSSAEVAIAVADAWQHRGIGRRLMDAAIAWSRELGIQRLEATMSTTNVPIQRLLRSLGLPVILHSAGELTGVTIDLAEGTRKAA